jgi:trimethylamine---corrinoid protein Co-methyltransferase
MTASNKMTFQTPQFSLLSDSQIQDLHLAALEVLRHTGIRFFHQEALEMLRRVGAFISDGNLVKFPASLVESAIASAPSRIIMNDRNGEAAVFLEGTRANFGTGSDTIFLLDPYTGEHRKFVEADLVDSYRLCDALPNIHFVMSNGLPSDVSTTRSYDVQMSLMLQHTTKPLVFVTDDLATCQRAIDMAAVVAGGHEALTEQQHILLYSEPSSPLQQSQTAVDKLLLMAQHRLPIVYSPAPLMGGTGPITIASGLVQAMAEIFSGLVVHQLKSPGAPFVFGAGLHHMDMSAAQLSYGAPEFQMTKGAIAELGRWYGLPTWGYAGCSDAKVMDEQAAIEATLAVMMAKLYGSNLVHDVGYMQSGLAFSYEMVVLTDELVAMADNFMKGIEVNPDTLMLDEIHNVGPGGHFMATDATLNRFRYFWFPTLFDRGRREKWLATGGTTLGERLNTRVKEILKEHQPQPLAQDKVRGINEILAQAGTS